MLKNITRLEAIVQDKIGHLYLDNDTPLPVVKEMLFHFLKYIGQVEDAVLQQQQAQKEQAEQEASVPCQDCHEVHTEVMNVN